MTFTYDPITSRGRVRLLVADVDSTNAVFTDDEIDTFLALEVDVFTSAALALETIAVNEALVLKVIQTLDLKTDGAKLAEVLLKRAAALRERGGDDPTVDTDDFAIAELALPVFGIRQRMQNEILRSRP